MDNQTFVVNLAKNLTSEHTEKIRLKTKCEFEFEFKDFNLNQIVDSTMNWAQARFH